MTAPGMNQAAGLHGSRILVVEDDYMIAFEVTELLSEAGAETLGPVSSLAEALALIVAADRINAALLDVSLHGVKVWPLVDALLERNVPIVLTTGYDVSAIPQVYAVLPRCQKPASDCDITRALGQALASAAHT